MPQTRQLFPTVLTLALASAACTAEDTPVDTTTAVDCVDTDGDGLSDCEEAQYGTGIHLVDTDGDGFDDFREIVELGFNPINNNYKFNPLIADTPRIRLDITSAPTIGLFTGTGTSIENTHEVQRSSESRSSVSTGSSSSNSHAVEWAETIGGSATVGVSVGFPFSVGGSAEATVSYESSSSTTSETSFSWSTDQTQENAKSLANTRAFATLNHQEINGGFLKVAVDVTNEGDIAYTLTNVAISAYMSTPGLDQILWPVGQLNYDDPNAFPAFTYAPGQGNGPMVFVNDRLSTHEAQRLLADSTNLHVEVVAYELTDEEGRSFTHNQTDIAARTATIIIDYGDGQSQFETERYQVATHVDAERSRVSVTDALENILRVPFEVDEDGALERVRDLEAEPANFGRWVVAHINSDGVFDSVDLYSQMRGAYDLADLELKSGDVLHLVYIEDVDNDGLGWRQEAAYGTDPLSPDSDLDGLLDGEEVNDLKTSPLLVDSDGDCLRDDEEVHGTLTDPSEHNPRVCDPTFNDTLFTWQARWFFFTSSMNGAPARVHVARPSEPIDLRLDWMAIGPELPGDDPCLGCQVQSYVGLQDHFSTCLMDTRLGTGDFQAANGDVVSFTAPAEPGVYYVTHLMQMEGGCREQAHTDDPELAVATIVVMDELEN